jgi:hypothetical protein
MKTKWIIPLFLVLLAATSVSAEDCTYGGKYSWTTCYGLEHAVIEAAIIKGVDMLEEPLGLPNATSRVAGAAACAAFFYREVKDGGTPFEDVDRTLDWLVPCAIGVFYDPGSNRQIGITNFIGGQPVKVGVVFSLEF